MKKKNVVLAQVPVSGYAAEGKALAKIDGKVIFIEGGVVPGDVVDVRLRKNKKDWAEGKAIHIHTYSPTRTEPFCEHLAPAAAANGRCCPMRSS